MEKYPLDTASPSKQAPSNAPVIRTPDQRVRVFISSTLEKLGPERAAAREATSIFRDDLNKHLAAARERLDTATFKAGWTVGQTMTLEQAITDALQDDE